MSKSSHEALRLVKHTFAALTRRDVNDALRYMAPNIDYVVNVDPQIAPFVASTSGIPELRARLELLFDTFTIETFDAKNFRISDDDPSIARVNVSYAYREKTTSVLLDGRFRCVIHIDDGLIAQVEEFHDRSYIEAFSRLIQMMRKSSNGRS